MKPVDQIAFGRRVAARRFELNLTQTNLADAVGMKQQGVASIEDGKVARPRMLREIAKKLQTTEKWLLWNEGSRDLDDADNPVVTTVPILDWVSAGKLVDVSSQIPYTDVPLLAFHDLGRGDFFGLTVVGDSVDRVSPDGSIIVVDRSDRKLISGKLYVFSYREGTTYKMWRPEPPRLAPYSTNPSNEPIFISGMSDIEVVGRVRRTVLDL